MTVPLLLERLEEEIDKLTKTSPVAGVRAVHRLEVIAERVGHWAVQAGPAEEFEEVGGAEGAAEDLAAAAPPAGRAPPRPRSPPTGNRPPGRGRGARPVDARYTGPVGGRGASTAGCREAGSFQPGQPLGSYVSAR